MGFAKLIRQVNNSFSKLDSHVIVWIQAHTDLLIAIANLGLALWAIATGHWLYVFGLLLIGAIGYFGGLVVGLVLVVLIMGMTVFSIGIHQVVTSVILLQTAGYLSVAWLGFRHKYIRGEQNRITTHKPQVLPWVIANDIRTSLAAIRFLLFPLNDEHSNQKLQQATNELSRLENLFNEIEKTNSRI